MKNVDIYGLLIITIFLGGFCTFLGGVIKSQNAADMLNNFDEKKYDKDKASKIMGKAFLTIGLSIFLVGFIGLILGKRYYNYISFIQSSIMIIGIVIGYYKLNKHGKLNKS